jgi:rhodanese-related sulfurtransferase
MGKRQRTKPRQIAQPVSNFSNLGGRHGDAASWKKQHASDGAPSAVANRGGVTVISIRTVVILGLSIGLGMMFNVSNPVGIRWASASAGSDISRTLVGTNTSPSPLTSPPLLPHSPPTTTSNQLFASASQIAWREAKPLVLDGKALLVDSRPTPHYDAGHIPGAISLPVESAGEAFEAFRQKYGTNTSLIVYCSSPSCSRSKALADTLIQQYGYALVRFMPGGYLEWQQAELSPSVAPPP